MGLDVYLYKCADKKTADRLENEYEERSEAIWAHYGKYEDLTDAQKEEARTATDALKEELGLVEWGTHPTKEKVEIDSALYPEHYFKIGYFRSSYNSGGINSVFRRRGLPHLDDVFLPNNRYEFAPNWKACLDRAEALLEECRAYNAQALGQYDCMEVSANMFGGTEGLPKSESDALGIFKGELEREHGCRAYNGGGGTFYLDGLKCVGFVPGLNLWKAPCVYVIYEKADAEEQDWYEQAMEIVVETIQYVLAQPDKENYYLVWSG